MRGLLLNSFYSSMGNIKLFLFIVLAAAAAVLVTGSATAQELLVYISITALSVNAVVSTRKDAASKWNKYEIALPIRRKEIITCKYVSYLGWVAAGTVLALAITAISMLLHGNSTVQNSGNSLFSIFALGIGISLLTASLFYPASYLLGVDKSETLLLISILLAIGCAIAVLHILNLYILSATLRTTAFMVFYLVVFGVSYLLTLSIFSRKEF